MTDVPLLPLSVHTTHESPKPCQQILLQSAKLEIDLVSVPSTPHPSPKPSHAVSTSVHLYSDVLLSKVFSILFEKTLPRNGPMMRLSRETATSFTLEASGSQCKSGQNHSTPLYFVAQFLHLQ
jgi:hypothetical protein